MSGEENPYSSSSPPPKKPRTSEAENIGDSVMRLLFESGNYKHILEDVFFLLDPRSLLACSLACKDWHAFLRENVWRTAADGETRIARNWLCKEPIRRRLSLLRDEPGVDERDKVPAALAANQDVVVVVMEGRKAYENRAAIPWAIDLYDRSTCRLKRRLLQVDHGGGLFSLRICMSSRYLAVVETGVYGGNVDVFQVQDDFQRVPMKDTRPPDYKRESKECYMVGEDALILANKHWGAQCFHISVETLRYKFMWRVLQSYGALAVISKDMLLCNTEYDLIGNNHTASLFFKLYGAIEGRLLRKPKFYQNKLKSISYGGHWLWAVLSVVYVRPVAIVLLRYMDDSNCRLELFDLERKTRLRTVNRGVFQLKQIWCHPSVGTLVAMARDAEAGKEESILVWDLRKLLREESGTDWIEPDRVIMNRNAKSRVYRDVMMSCGNRLLYLEEDDDKTVFLADCDFWGRL